MRTLTIEYGERGPHSSTFDVVDECGRRCNGLTLGEMLEQVIGLTVEKRVRFQMLTEEGWADRARRAELRRQERELEREGQFFDSPI